MLCVTLPYSSLVCVEEASCCCVCYIRLVLYRRGERAGARPSTASPFHPPLFKNGAQPSFCLLSSFFLSFSSLLSFFFLHPSSSRTHTHRQTCIYLGPDLSLGPHQSPSALRCRRVFSDFGPALSVYYYYYKLLFIEKKKRRRNK